MKRLMPLVLLAACLGTETGNPPLEPVELDRNLLTFNDEGESVQVVGSAGAVMPGGANVQFTPLDGSPAFRVVSEADGSFLIEQPFTAEVRLQAIEGRSRSDVFDHDFVSDAFTAVCQPVPNVDFVRIDGRSGEDAIGYVTVRWPCGNPPSATMLYGNQGLSVGGATGGVTTQSAQDTLTLAITFDGRAGEVEDHVVVSMGTSRAVITVVAEACDDECRRVSPPEDL